MRAITVENPGKDYTLRLYDAPMPTPGQQDVLIRVQAAGINRADLLQAEGLYPPPENASPLLGLEVAGIVEAVGSAVTRYTPGDRVCALIGGGGYAGYALAPAAHTLPIPETLDFRTAASLPEACFTVWKNLVMLAQLKAGETILIHGGTSGIGSFAIQIASLLGAKVIASVGSDTKRQACLDLGAEQVIHYKSENWDIKADVILDLLGGPYLQRNLHALNYKGRWIVIAVMNGSKGEINMASLLMKNIALIGSTLRSASVEEKSLIARELEQHLWPHLQTGALRPLINRSFPLQSAQEAHNYLRTGNHQGKIILEP